MSRWLVGVVALTLVAGCLPNGFLSEDDPPPPPPSPGSVFVGDGFSCAGISNPRTDEPAIVCWGANVATTYPPDVSLSRIMAAGRHACALGRDREVICWGDPDDLAAGPTPSLLTETLTVSPTHNCALHTAVIPVCWGTGPGAVVPQRPEFYGADIVAGSGHTCMRMYAGQPPVCWGRDDLGQSSPPPIEFQQMVAGDGFTCGLTPITGPAGGMLVCWGRVLPNTPAGASFRNLYAAPSYVCGIDDAGMARCWGDAPASVLSPPPVQFQSVAIGRDHGCGVTIEAEPMPPRVVCWGDNSQGQLDAPEIE